MYRIQYGRYVELSFFHSVSVSACQLPTSLPTSLSESLGSSRIRLARSVVNSC